MERVRRLFGKRVQIEQKLAEVFVYVSDYYTISAGTTPGEFQRATTTVVVSPWKGQMHLKKRGVRRTLDPSVVSFLIAIDY